MTESSPPRRDELLEIAERMIRTEGYNGFSTRNVATAAGIKAASVHYHFPTKSDIGAAVTRRYTDRFITALGDPARFAGDGSAATAAFIAMFRHALHEDRQLCLCAVLGAEAGGLPDAVRAETRFFFERNLAWLTAALAGGSSTVDAAQTRAIHLLAALEGAMIIAMMLNDETVFERVAGALASPRP